MPPVGIGRYGIGLPVIEADADDAPNIAQLHCCAALQGHQCSCGSVDDDVPANAIHIEQAAYFADLQAHLQ